MSKLSNKKLYYELLEEDPEIREER